VGSIVAVIVVGPVPLAGETEIQAVDSAIAHGIWSPSSFVASTVNVRKIGAVLPSSVVAETPPMTLSPCPPTDPR
jgi:ABC-type thiamin/hydroxymethylpyrimidine transport system permease subunit